MNNLPKTIADLSNEQLDKLADLLVEQSTDKADRLATVIGWNLQDKQRREQTMLKITLETNGTHLQSTFLMPYGALLTAIGQPHYKFSDFDDIENKVDVEWAFELPSGDVATIYNWKDGPAYLGHQGKPVENITKWHIGGHKLDVVHELLDIINLKLEEEGYNLNEDA
tara:strand:- start:10818 stop:11321 length:504 start_codon:yes stop_codon:yes gene_type:complete